MNCRYCGVEIADKALVCYRCGRATTESRPRRTTSSKGGGGARVMAIVPSIAALLLLVIVALFMGQVSSGETPRVISWIVAALAVVLAVWRIMRWRSRTRR